MTRTGSAEDSETAEEWTTKVSRKPQPILTASLFPGLLSNHSVSRYFTYSHSF